MDKLSELAAEFLRFDALLRQVDSAYRATNCTEAYMGSFVSDDYGIPPCWTHNDEDDYCEACKMRQSLGVWRRACQQGKAKALAKMRRYYKTTPAAGG